MDAGRGPIGAPTTAERDELAQLRKRVFQRQTDGGRLRTVEDRLRRLDQRAGVRRVRGSLMHTLRRTWATRLAAAGVNAEHLRRLGGWSSLAVVQNSYLGRIPDAALREAISVLG